jgi:uncharacterized protein
MTPRPMHFAINADDVPATTAFYAALFGWEFAPLMPGFERAELGDGMIVAVQERRQLGDAPITGFEATIPVDDLGAVIAGVVANGGRVLMDRSEIPTVGQVAFFADPAGNVFGAIEFAQ